MRTDRSRRTFATRDVVKTNVLFAAINPRCEILAYVALALALSTLLTALPAACGSPPGIQRQSRGDNAPLVPAWKPDSRVQMEGMSPDWVKTLIMAELRIETATSPGTFASAIKVLDHYAEMGVNGLWINPIFERSNPERNGYNNRGPNTLDPLLTGTSNLAESFKVVKQFVAEAHRRNIRILFDIIVWGTSKDAPLVSEHPEFYRRRDGQFVEVWGGYAFDWRSQPLREWFKNAAIGFIEKTDADGFRVDLAPDTSGYFFEEIRSELYVRGRKIALISEVAGEPKKTFDFEQIGVHGWTERPDWQHPEKLKEQRRRFGRHNEYLLHSNIVDVIKSGVGIGAATLQQQGRGGMYRFYTSNLLCHDDAAPFVRGSRVRIGYTAIFAPLIPMWFIGEEWNNPRTVKNVMYFNAIDWPAMDEPTNRAFYEDVKQMIRIRRSYPEIFEYYPADHRDSNICKVEVQGNALQPYARYRNGRGILVIPNDGAADRTFQITVPLAGMGMTGTADLQVTDLMTRNILARGSAAKTGMLHVPVKQGHVIVLLIDQTRVD